MSQCLRLRSQTSRWVDGLHHRYFPSADGMNDNRRCGSVSTLRNRVHRLTRSNSYNKLRISAASTPQAASSYLMVLFAKHQVRIRTRCPYGDAISFTLLQRTELWEQLAAVLRKFLMHTDKRRDPILCRESCQPCRSCRCSSNTTELFPDRSH